MPQRIDYIGNWNDDSADIRELVSDLKSAGIRAKSDYSIYIGMNSLKIAVEDVENAKKILRDIGEDYIADNCLN